MNVSLATLTEILTNQAKASAEVLDNADKSKLGNAGGTIMGYARWSGAKAYFEELAFTLGCSREWSQSIIRNLERDFGL